MIIIRPNAITDAVLTSSNVPETDEAEYDPATTYASGSVVMVTTAGVHSIYVSLQNSNLGNQPQDDDPVNPVYWARRSATNRWAMFSDQISDQTEQADEIIVDLLPGSVTNGLTLYNLDASEVQIVLNDPTDGEVYNKTFNLVDASGVFSWYDYYFEPVSRQTVLAVLDIPPYSSATITLTIRQTGGTAKCGLCAIGSQRRLGETDYGSSVGIVDYSRKERDTFGEPVIVQRNYSDRVDYAVTSDTNRVGVIRRTLAEFRTTPMTFIGSADFPETVVYGYYRDFNIVLSNPTKSLMSIYVEGLT